MLSSLPTSRRFLTSLLNAISQIPVPQQEGPGAVFGSRAPSNPLQRIDPAHRPLLTTLHVLFPSLLLPALDLLDRGLVCSLKLEPRSTKPAPAQAQGQSHVAATPIPEAEGLRSGLVANDEEQGRDPQPAHSTPAPSIYIVRSAQQPRRFRRGSASAATGFSASAGCQAYVVHVDAWNCSCAAFAFAAFPSGPSSPGPFDPNPTREGEGDAKGGKAAESRDVGGGKVDLGPGLGSFQDRGSSPVEADEAPPGGADEPNDGWEFGGLSLSGTEGDAAEGVPCCKHLLACVLAERWSGGLGRYVVERTVAREEMAGIIADI